jgi:hypothetical protein
MPAMKPLQLYNRRSNARARPAPTDSDATRGNEVFTLVPKLLLGNPVSKALALRDGKLELPTLNSQAGAWELAY